MKNYFTLAFFITLSKVLFAQEPYISHYTLDSQINKRALTDNTTRTKYILESAGISIVAIKSTGEQLWKTDPWKDNKLPTYRKERPIIVSFSLANNKQTQNKEVIWLIYNNTQFGYLDKNSGKFFFLGQD